MERLVHRWRLGGAAEEEVLVRGRAHLFVCYEGEGERGHTY